jgi:LAO/AO transport system kinase
MKPDSSRPSWVPENPGREFATRVRAGVRPAKLAHTGEPRSGRGALDPSRLAAGVLHGDRTLLARAITLVESHAPTHRPAAEALLRELTPHAGKALRVAITGVPGVGKSSFIETLGMWLCERKHQVAVLAIDPSSILSGGSLLGDKTRMEKLSRHPQAFIRPSPTGGTLGGVTRTTRETMLCCEAAGYDVVLVETVGVGQAEVAARAMTDFFLLLALAGAGDELQGLKKGVVELADAVVVNKCDGDNVARAQAATGQYASVLRQIRPATEGWRAVALGCSALTGTGVPEIWAVIEKFAAQQRASGAFDRRRAAQALGWFEDLVWQELRARFQADNAAQERLAAARADVVAGRLPASLAAKKVFGE